MRTCWDNKERMVVPMKKLISGRQTGKTEKLIRLSAETNAPIVTKDLNTAMNIMKRAKKLELDIPHPINVDSVMDERLNDYQITTGIIVDDADYVLGAILSKFNVGPITAISICNDDIQDELI